MIDINLNKIYKSYGFNVVLNNIDMIIYNKEKIGLIGPNGCGKSTILKIINKIENIDYGTLSIRNNVTIGYLSQIPSNEDIIVKDYIMSAFSEILVLENKLIKYEKELLSNDKIINKYIKLQEEYINKSGYEYKTQIDKILYAFNITNEMLERNYNTLSGGEKTIISLIKVLLRKPDILLLDEPTNHLDIKKIEWLEKFLKNYNGTVILVSHDRYFMDNVVDKIFLLTKRGIEEYFGNYSYYVKESENRLLLETKKYKDQQKIIESMKKSIKKLQEFGKLCSPSGGEIFFRRANSIKKRLEKLEKLDKPLEKQSFNLMFNNSIRSGNDVLKINNLNISFKDKIIFKDLNINLNYKDRVCLIGPNGCGKTTLIKEILNNNKNIKLGSNIKLGYVPQEIIFEDDNLTILEESRKYFISSEEHLRSALFKYLFVGDNVHKKIKYLSGGEKVRLKLFCLIQDEYNFLILDEPTNHIDIDTREMLEEALLEFNGTILFVSHDRYFINKIANYIYEIKDYNINKYIGNYDDYINIYNKKQ